MSKKLWVEKYAQNYKTSDGSIEGWEVRFYLADSVAELLEKEDNADFTESWCLDEDFGDMDEREDLEWWDTHSSGPPVTWYIADPSGFDDVECPELLSAVINGTRFVPEELKKAIVARDGSFEELDGKPTE